jgi:hypothetical protein
MTPIVAKVDIALGVRFRHKVLDHDKDHRACSKSHRIRQDRPKKQDGDGTQHTDNGFDKARQLTVPEALQR